MSDQILANARIVLADGVLRGSLLLRDGKIADISSGTAVPPGAEDLAGDFLLPGLVELHTDNLERHIEPRPEVDWPHEAAIIAHDAEMASVGITTVFDALRVGSQASEQRPGNPNHARAVADGIRGLQDGGALRVSHFLHLRAELCSQTLIPDLAQFCEEDGIGIVSLMDHTPGQRQFRDPAQYRSWLRSRRRLSETEFEAHVAIQQALSARVGAVHEAATLREAARLGAVLASHDDTTVEQVAQSAQNGARLAEFPTTSEAARACRDKAIAVMIGAPNLISGGSQAGNVAARDLAENDLVDIVSSDFVPSSLLAAGLMLGDLWGDLPRGVGAVTLAPALTAGLTDRGQIAPGLRADLIRVARFGTANSLRGTWVAGRRVA